MKCADLPWTVFFNPFKNPNTGIFSETVTPWDDCSPFQDVFVHFLIDVPETNEFLEPPIVNSSPLDELRGKQQFRETFEEHKLKRFTNPNFGFWGIWLK